MVKRIDQDHKRFRQIVHGAVKKDLRKYITHDELIGKKGKDFISIPIPRIDIPRFRFDPGAGGVGQGEDDIGTDIGSGPGDEPGQHLIEVDISLEEMAAVLGEELELPNIQPKGNKNVVTEKNRYSGIYRNGPESLRHFKRTYKEALRRSIASGTYNSKDPIIIPIREDRRYRSPKKIILPDTSAVVIYMMDASGSMEQEQKDIVRLESFWIDTWLRSQYKSIELRYIVHDVEAKEVDYDTFFHIREGGGTKISSAYKLCDKLLREQFSDDWNVYLFHFSDGDNSSSKDTEECVATLEKELIPKANLFCYGQVKSSGGRGGFLDSIEQYFAKEEKVTMSRIDSKDDIYDSIKTFLGKGK